MLLLREMRDAAVMVVELVEGWTTEEIEAEPIRRAALLWHFTVLGEAASQVPAETRGTYPAVAWKGATRMRNRIVHGYWDIDVETLLTTAVEDLPAMIADLEDVISSLESSGDASLD